MNETNKQINIEMEIKRGEESFRAAEMLLNQGLQLRKQEESEKLKRFSRKMEP